MLGIRRLDASDFFDECFWYLNILSKNRVVYSRRFIGGNHPIFTSSLAALYVENQMVGVLKMKTEKRLGI